MERESPLPGRRTDFLRWESSLQPNVSFVIGGAQEMLEGRIYHAVDIVVPIVMGYIELVTGNKKPSQIT